MPKKPPPPNPGIHFDRFDIERLGLFGDPPAFSARLKKVNKKDALKPENTRSKGAQFMTEAFHIKDSTGVGYFDPEYRRLFIGEVIVRRKKKKKDPRDDEVIMPTNPAKLHSTPGDYYGCFEKYEYFPLTLLKKKKKKKERELPNCLTSPPGFFHPWPERLDPRPRPIKKSKKKPGSYQLFLLNHYTDAYFGPDPYFVEKFRATYVPPKPPKPKKNEKVFQNPVWLPNGPGKMLGGGKWGGFTKFPGYISPRLKKKKKVVEVVLGEYRYQSYGDKTMYTRCINSYNVSFKCNHQNYLDYQPQYVSKYIK